MKSNEEKTETPSFEREVWDKLSRIDVGDYIETKGDRFKLSYLSWTFAVAELMKAYPESFFTRLPQDVFEDGTVMVNMGVTVKEGDREIMRLMWLPVMDNRNTAVQQPNALQVSNSMMRCLTKCIALFGLGLDVYAGSDMPIGSTDDPIDEAQAEMITGLLKQSGRDKSKFLAWLGADSVETIPRKSFKKARGQLERAIKAKKK
jgi:hypothetical protein